MFRHYDEQYLALTQKGISNMCGIYGYIGKPNKTTKQVIRALAVLNEARGKDSCGLAVITKDSVQVEKKAQLATQFYLQHKPEQLIPNEFAIVMGHNRLATTGAITDDNAHPFQVGDYLFTHNGVIFNHWQLEEQYGVEVQVDSQMIGHALNQVTEEREAFEKHVTGWYTAPYVNLHDRETLKIATHQAPLAFAILPGHQGLYYSSDIVHLTAALQRFAIKASLCRGGADRIYTFKWNGERIFTSKEFITPKPMAFSGNVYGRGGRGDYGYADSDDRWGGIDSTYLDDAPVTNAWLREHYGELPPQPPKILESHDKQLIVKMMKQIPKPLPKIGSTTALLKRDDGRYPNACEIVETYKNQKELCPQCGVRRLVKIFSGGLVDWICPECEFPMTELN